MERRGQDRDTSYTPPPRGPESPVKLPLAAILSTPTERRGNAAPSIRRGSSIFSPTQTLDHQNFHPQNNRQHLSPPPPPTHVIHKAPSPDPDPDPSTPIADGPSDSRTPPPQPNNTNIRYRECQKNHAASMGGHVLDGCGEFMPNGEEGTTESLRCAACDCHRNFHRKEGDGVYHIHHPGNRSTTQTPPPPLVAGMVSFGGGRAAEESSSEDLNMYQQSGSAHAEGSKKRFRTKFSQEQKDRMQEVANKLGWRIQKEDEHLVQQLCQETGINRQVFKVWMHNNKQAMKKRQI